MKLNKYQKRTLSITAILSVAVVLVWIGFGMEIFTKSRVIIEKTDEVFGTTYKEFEDRFILGLDYTAAFSFIIVLLSAGIIFLQRKK